MMYDELHCRYSTILDINDQSNEIINEENYNRKLMRKSCCPPRGYSNCPPPQILGSFPKSNRVITIFRRFTSGTTLSSIDGEDMDARNPIAHSTVLEFW